MLTVPPLLISALAASIGGSALTLAFSPFHFWPLAVLSPAVLLWCLLRAGNWRQALLLGWLFGLGFWLGGVHWVYFSIHTYGGAPVVAALFLTVAFAAGLALLQALMALGWYGVRTGLLWWDSLVLFPPCWILVEWLKSWLLTGFPWLNLGVSAVDWWAVGWLPVLGAPGVSWLLVLLAAYLVAVLATAGREHWGGLVQGVALFGVLALGGAALQGVLWVADSERRISARIVQTNQTAFERWGEGGIRKSLDKHMQLTGVGAQLVLWSEASLPLVDSWPGADRLIDQLRTRFGGNNQTLALGMLHGHGEEEVYNSMRLIGADEGLYLKSHLVPFGEFTPAVFRPLQQLFTFPASSMSAGPTGQSLPTVAGVPVLVAICYEIAYRRHLLPASAQAGLILTNSNDSWFGRSIGPWQHLQIARARAAESRRWTLRSTNGGIGGAIDAFGQMREQLTPFADDAVSVSVPVYLGATPASLLADWVYALVAVLAIGGVALIAHCPPVRRWAGAGPRTLRPDPMTAEEWRAFVATHRGMAIAVEADRQMLHLYENGELQQTWQVSTAAKGLGNEQDSGCTPIGLHSICARIGSGFPVGAVLAGRRPTGVIAAIERRPLSTGADLITTRILWLSGLEVGNGSAGCSSKDRYIYIHGTPEEGLIGQPVSHGCIRMRNLDVMELYDRVAEGCPVFISS